MSSHRIRSVIVTGGGSGIGQAIAEAFVREGAQVAIIGRREENLRKAVQILGSRSIYQKADVSQRDQVVAAVEAIVQKFASIDVLINAAGFVREFTTNTPLETAEKIWDDIIATNLKGIFLMVMAVAPYLPRPGGRIISISSITAFNGGRRPGSMAYAAAKAGLHGLTYSLARELGPQGVTVNAIAPGFIANTESTGKWPQERINSIIAETPINKAGHVNDVASAACYLASPNASFITGEVLNVNGGWLFGH